MGYVLYQQCSRSVKHTLDILEVLRQRQAVTAATVQAARIRRSAAAIALQATFEELRHAFLTPLDREELLRLRQVCEALPRAAENVMLTLYVHKRQALPAGDTLLLAAVTDCCLSLNGALDGLESYPRSEATVQQLILLDRQLGHAEETYWQCSVQVEPVAERIYDALRAVAGACADAAEMLRYVLLKLS